MCVCVVCVMSVLYAVIYSLQVRDEANFQRDKKKNDCQNWRRWLSGTAAVASHQLPIISQYCATIFTPVSRNSVK